MEDGIGSYCRGPFINEPPPPVKCWRYVVVQFLTLNSSTFKHKNNNKTELTVNVCLSYYLILDRVAELQGDPVDWQSS